MKKNPLVETLIFHTMMITLKAVEKRLPIHAIEPNGQIIYSDKINGCFLWDIPRSSMCEQDCDCDSWFYHMPGNDLWCKACTGACKKHPANCCKPSFKPQRKFNPDNDP